MEWGIFEPHKRGLALLRRRLAPEHVRYADLLVLEHRLSENIAFTLVYGDSEERRSGRAQIIDALNGLATELFGQSFLDLGEASVPSAAAPSPRHTPDGQLVARADATYYLSAYAINLITQICTSPGYHVVLAESGYGKTALMGYLAQRRRPVSVAYTFTRVEGRRSVDMALESLREQLRSLGNLTSAHHYELPDLIQKVVSRFQPWSSTRRNNWSQLLILLDGIDECEPSERELFQDLLPAQLPANVSVVVTMRPAVRKAITAHFLPSHPFCQRVGGRELRRLRGADIRRLMFEHYHVYIDLERCHQVEQLSGGHPATVFFICRQLEDAIKAGQDLEEALGRLPPLHTVHDLFAHELEQMELRCSSAADWQLFRRMLGTLVAARQPLSPAELAEVLDVSLAALEALAQRLDRFRRPTDDGGLAFGSPQFAEYLLGLAEWRAAIDRARAGWDAWVARQQAEGGPPPPASALVERVRQELLPALRAHEPRWLADWEAIFTPSIRSREDWLAVVNRAWAEAEARPGCSAEELLIYALLITSWPQPDLALLPRGDTSPDYEQGQLLTDQLRDLTQLPGQELARDLGTLIGLLTGESSESGLGFESFVFLVSELGQAWRAAPGPAPQQFAQILRLITQAVRRQARVSPLISPRANLLEALSVLAPAIQRHVPESVEGICHVVDTFIEVLP